MEDKVQDDGGEKNEEWVVGVGEDGKVGVYGDITLDRNGSGMLDGGLNISWDDLRVSDGLAYSM